MSAIVFAQLIHKWKAVATDEGDCSAESVAKAAAYARCAYELEDVLDRLDILSLPHDDPRMARPDNG